MQRKVYNKFFWLLFSVISLQASQDTYSSEYALLLQAALRAKAVENFLQSNRCQNLSEFELEKYREYLQQYEKLRVNGDMSYSVKQKCFENLIIQHKGILEKISGTYYYTQCHKLMENTVPESHDDNESSENSYGIYADKPLINNERTLEDLSVKFTFNSQTFGKRKK